MRDKGRTQPDARLGGMYPPGHGPAYTAPDPTRAGMLYPADELHADETVLRSVTQDERAAQEHAIRTAETTAEQEYERRDAVQIPLVLPVANTDWYGETFQLEFGDSTGTNGKAQVLARDPLRRTADITNQSGNGVTVVLCRTRADADRIAQRAGSANPTLPNNGRFIRLPDGTGRTITHTGDVWVVIDPAAAAIATVDVMVERRGVVLDDHGHGQRKQR